MVRSSIMLHIFFIKLQTIIKYFVASVSKLLTSYTKYPIFPLRSLNCLGLFENYEFVFIKSYLVRRCTATCCIDVSGPREVFRKGSKDDKKWTKGHLKKMFNQKIIFLSSNFIKTNCTV